ncbi:Ig-like domain-containing protein [Curtobacterium sp. DN_7.5]|uniref:Ig-like domain-containing protein n=1 Tax=Curtobacterium sp. DN_7.5 TaxID=3049047 RepID=UPI001F592480|nr:Ig-like domain-containing protein [Curtobacterium sp. DN_7.5]
MSSKKKRLAKGLGAGALAVATIASGLSFGAASASAATGSDEVLGTMKFLTGTSGIVSTTSSHGEPFAKWQQYSTATQAAQRATTFDILPSQRPGAYEYRSQDSGLCIYFSTPVDYEGIPVVAESGCGNSIQGIFFKNGSFYGEDWGWLGNWAALATYNRTWPGAGGSSATAAVGNRGQVGNTSWNDLPPLLGGVAKLTAQGSFDTDIAKKATVSGTAEPDATITLKNGTTTLGTTTAAADGTYSFDVTAPNKGGALALTVTQTVDGKDGGSKDVSLDYGKAVAITGPEDQDEVPAGSTAITGSGEAGSDVQVFDNSGRTPVISTKVRSNGTWSGTATLTAGEHTLEAKQMSKGANTTTSTVTVNPGDGASDAQPVALDAKFDADDAYGLAVLSGTGEPNATVSFRNTTTGATISSATVDADGAYSVKIPASAIRYGVNSFTATQTVDGSTTTATDTLDFGAEPAAPVIQTPSAGSTINPGSISFAGTGQADTKLTVRGTNTTVAPLVSTMVNAQGRWSGDSIRELRGMSYRIFAIQTVKGGLQKQTDVTFTVRASAGQSVTLAAAFDQADQFAPAILSGRGEPGATVRVVNTSKNNATVGTAVVGDNGQYRLTVPVSAAQYGVNAFRATQDVNGTSTTATANLDYGTAPAPVEITSPAQNAVVSPNGLRFSGTGQANAQITVRGTNTTNPALASTIVRANGTWDADAVRTLSSMQYRLWATQTTKGGLNMRDEVLFNVQATPVSIDAAFNTEDRTKPATVSGRGENGATVVVTNTTTNKEIGRATIVDNRWSLTVDPKNATYGSNSFTVKQTLNGAETSATDTLNYGTEPMAPTVTSPVPNSNAEGDRVPQGTISFAGTGTPGTQVTVQGTNTTVPPLVTTTVQPNGQWAADSIRALNKHQQWALTATVTTNGGLTKSTPFTFWTQP